MFQYPIWYRRYGVRRLAMFALPLTFGINKLQMPLSTVINLSLIHI